MNSTAQNKSTVLIRAYIIPRLFSLIVLIIGFLSLSGWVFQVEALKRVLPGLPAMNPLTAMLFIVTSSAFFLLIYSSRRTYFKPVASILSIVSIIVALLRIYDYFTQNSLGIDAILFADQITSSSSPSHMGLGTAFNFIFIDLALSISLLSRGILRRSRQFFIFTVLLMASTVLFFYYTRGLLFLQTPLFFSMALHTAVSFVLITVGFFYYIKYDQNKPLYIFDLRFLAGMSFIYAFLWMWVISPEVTKIPDNFSYAADIFSSDNFYDSDTQQYSGEIRSITSFAYIVKDTKNSILEILNSFDVKTPTGEPIFSVSRVYGINPYTGRHVSGYGDRDRNGYLFAPRNLKKQDFDYWHINYDAPAHMHFVKEDELSGLRLFQYETDFHADQTQNLTNLPDVGKTKGINLDIHLTMWVEPITGRMIKYEDHSIAYYYDLLTGERLYPWNKFSNSFSNHSAESQVGEAQAEIQTILIVERYVPFSLFALGVFLFVAFLLQKFRKISILSYLPFILLLGGLAGTFLVWRFTSDTIEQQSHAKFENETADLKQVLLSRLEIYENALYGGRGLFDASDQVTRGEWNAYVTSLNIQKHFPGIQGIGYSEVIVPEKLQSFEKRIRDEGFSDFKVTPPGDRDIYTSIIYLEPFDERNKRAFGYDMFSNDIRRTAMEMARNTGDVAISGKVTLLQETSADIQAGFLMYVPVFKKNVSLNSITNRSNALLGYVYSPFRMNDFMHGALFDNKYDIDLEIFDGDSTLDDQLIYDDDRGEYSRDPGYTPQYKKTETISLYGHHWTIEFISSPDFGLDSLQKQYPDMVLRIGIVMSILFTISMYSLSSSRIRALRLANEITHDLQQKEHELVEAQRVGKFGTFTWELKSNLVTWSDQSFLLYGFSPTPNHASLLL